MTAGLTVGPWTHGHMMTKAAPTVLRETLDWLGTHLGGESPTRSAPVRIHVNGVGWRDLPEWPPAAKDLVLFPSPGGGLQSSPPDSGQSQTFVYNPADPTPTVGGRLLSPAGGYRDDASLSRRADTLTFTSDPLPTDLQVIGTPEVQLSHSCPNPYNDLFVRISQVDAQGGSRNVSDGYLAAAPSGAARIELDSLAWTFPAGSRIRVLVAGGSHPRFLRNRGTGELSSGATTFATARHTVHLGEATRLTLPVSGD